MTLRINSVRSTAAQLAGVATLLTIPIQPWALDLGTSLCAQGGPAGSGSSLLRASWCAARSARLLRSHAHSRQATRNAGLARHSGCACGCPQTIIYGIILRVLLAPKPSVAWFLQPAERTWLQQRQDNVHLAAVGNSSGKGTTIMGVRAV